MEFSRCLAVVTRKCNSLYPIIRPSNGWEKNIHFWWEKKIDLGLTQPLFHPTPPPHVLSNFRDSIWSPKWNSCKIYEMNSARGQKSFLTYTFVGQDEMYVCLKCNLKKPCQTANKKMHFLSKNYSHGRIAEKGFWNPPLSQWCWSSSHDGHWLLIACQSPPSQIMECHVGTKIMINEDNGRDNHSY